VQPPRSAPDIPGMSEVWNISSAARQTARREIGILSGLLKSGEQLTDICHGTADRGRTAIVAVTDQRLMYLQRRFLWGARVESVPLGRVRSAEEQIGVRHATVSIDAGGRMFALADVDRALAQVFCARLRARLRENLATEDC